jgi:phosphoglycerate dehydrogenase-like enzyme
MTSAGSPATGQDPGAPNRWHGTSGPAVSRSTRQGWEISINDFIHRLVSIHYDDSIEVAIMKLHIHIVRPSDKDFLDSLRSLLRPEIVLTSGSELPVPAEYHILVDGVPEREFLTASSNLHTVLIPWAGLSTRTRDVLLEFPHLAVHNLHYNAAPVAETAIALMLAAAKRLVPIDRTFRKHDWSPRYSPGGSMLLDGKTALIVGFGAIGRHIGLLCHGLGMKVTATRRTLASTDDTFAQIHSASLLHRLLPRASVLFISAALTPDTRGLIGKEELALLPDGAVVVNVARGPIIDEAALFEELKGGRIRAGLDVWYNYPKEEKDRANTPPSAYPFHELDNVVMTPHMAEESDESEFLRVTALAEVLNAAAAGDPLPNKVDPNRGY